MIRHLLRKFISKIYNFTSIFKNDRLNVFSLMSFIIFATITIKLISLSYFKRDFLLSFANKQYHGIVNLFYERGEILDRNGAPLAISIKTCSFYVRPSMIKNKELFSKVVSKYLNMDGSKVLDLLNDNPHSKFRWLIRNQEMEIKKARKVIRQILFGSNGYYKLSGEKAFKKKYPDLIGVLPEFKRVYPYGVASSVVGVINNSGNGQSGLEYLLEKKKIIIGRKTILRGKRDALGRIYITNPSALFVSYSKGNNVVLTIDGNIQYMVEKIISKYGRMWNPNFINVVLMNPYNGDVLAAASYPFYSYGNERGKDFLSLINPRFITTPYEPGSVMKPIVVAAAINEGIMTPYTRINCPAKYVVGNKAFHNEFHGERVTLTAGEVIIFSDNVGIIKIAQKLGKKRYYDYLKAFGFGEKTGIELPGESAPRIRNYDKWKDVEFATLAFGHNIMVNTLQIAKAYAALLNGGILVKPRILMKIVNDKGEVTKEFKPVHLRRVISKEASFAIRRILTGVVEEGTGTRAKLKNFFIAGKTGTAKKYDKKTNSYSKTRITATFAGAFPATNPEYILVVTIDEPKVAKDMLWAAKTAVPIFKEIAERVLLYERETPDKLSYTLRNGIFISSPINENFPFKTTYRKIEIH